MWNSWKCFIYLPVYMITYNSHGNSKTKCWSSSLEHQQSGKIQSPENYKQTNKENGATVTCK